jgi:hypothetical protein
MRPARVAWELRFMSKLRKYLRRPSPSMVVSLLALAISIGGGAAYAANTVFSSDIVDGEVHSVDLGDNSVNTNKIQNGQVSNADLAASSVTNTRLAAGAVSSSKVLANSLTGGQINESTLSTVPTATLAANAGQLDGLDSTEFTRIFAFYTTDSCCTALTAGDNYQLIGAFTASATGKCAVTADTQIGIGGSAANPNETGPYYRTALAVNGGSPTNDFLYGHYFTWSAGGVYSDDMNRTSVWSVHAGDSLQFGTFYGGASGTWVTAYPSTHFTIICGTVGTLPQPSSVKRSSSGQSR